MESVTETKSKRQNRTVTLYVGHTLAEYEQLISTPEGLESLIRQVEIADSIDWGPLADGHHAGCPRQLQFTHHDSYSRWVKHFDGTQASGR